MSGIGTPGLIVILLVAILLFGPKKLPELGASIGKTLREFKKASREITEELQEGETVREK
ncbi:twin-arginine translocase TatA/TatE family subunit [bacterium D16-50]|jgi:sec-independent protein translocase protein TatA|nr:twin-arginine translocase TatA/TatE family subunit [Lachnospiraceae bacterium]RKJ19148.1 twin-arginine translocase TatA/TatE family subunit [bacterium D16-50]